MKKISMAVNVVFVVILFALITPFSHLSFAKSGCCSWHGGVSYCDSDSGRYVCNDGTYSPSCTCGSGFYIPPVPICVKPTVGDSAYQTFSQNECNQDITFTWAKGINDDFYSVAISKSAGTDPGPKSDTTQTSFTFSNVAPGKWYINLKPGRSCGWGDIVYWEIDVPTVKPNVELTEEIVNENKRLLHYEVACATKATITSEVGSVELPKGFVQIIPTKTQSYSLTAYNGTEETSTSTIIKYPLSRETTISTLPISPITTNVQDARRDYLGNVLLGAWTLVGIGAFINWLNRKRVKGTILLLEDELNLRAVCKEALNQAGYKVYDFSTPREAKMILDTDNVHLILSNMMLPEENGIQFLQEVKANPKWKHIPFVFLTALSNATIESKAFKLGCDGYIVKSELTSDKLVEKVNNWFKKKNNETWMS